jgi:hypothetical protein
MDESSSGVYADAINARDDTSNLDGGAKTLVRFLIGP